MDFNSWSFANASLCSQLVMFGKCGVQSEEERKKRARDKGTESWDRHGLSSISLAMGQCAQDILENER
ncbi:hypothetical protein FKM82_014971 [Ascaphus truei]